MTIEPPEILLADSEDPIGDQSMPSPIVIHDKMLTSAIPNPMISGPKQLLSPSGIQFEKAYQKFRAKSPTALSPRVYQAIKRSVDDRRNAGLHVDTDTIVSVLMELNESECE